MSDELLSRALLVVVPVLAGGLTVWLAKATAGGRVGRNPVAGIRLPVTMANDEAWLAAHQAARRLTEAAGWVAIVCAVPAALPMPLPLAVAFPLTGVVVMLVLVLRGAAVGARAAQAVTGGGNSTS